MYTAKDIVIKPISSSDARKIVSIYHYSGKSTMNSQIHFGVFIGERLLGALQYGPSIDKRRMALNLGIGMNEFLELNRMALSDVCPKNSESRALGITLRLLKKTYPFLKLVISFADACQCGDGTIYRASGFKLHSFKKNDSLLIASDGNITFKHGTKDRPTVVAKKSLDYNIDPATGKYLSAPTKLKPMEGFQMKYIYFFDKVLEQKFKFVEFDKIPNDVKMYKGVKCATGVESGMSTDQVEGGGESPTVALHLNDPRIKVVDT